MLLVLTNFSDVLSVKSIYTYLALQKYHFNLTHQLLQAYRKTKLNSSFFTKKCYHQQVLSL